MKINHEVREEFYAKKFLELFDISYNRIAKGDDPPDLVLFLDESLKIAIEMTEFHSNVTSPSGKPRRAIEENWNVLLKEIRQQRKNHPVLNCVSCVIFFKTLDLPKKKSYDQFVSDLISLLLEKENELTSTFKEYSACFKTGPLTEFVQKIIASKTRCNYIEWNWNHSAAAIGLSEEELKTAISSKVLTTFHRNRFKEVWLIIVSGHEMSQAMGLPHIERLNEFRDVNAMLDKSQFDRSFLYEFMFDRILERERDSGWIQKNVTPDLKANPRGKNAL